MHYQKVLRYDIWYTILVKDYYRHIDLLLYSQKRCFFSIIQYNLLIYSFIHLTFLSTHYVSATKFIEQNNSLHLILYFPLKLTAMPKEHFTFIAWMCFSVALLLRQLLSWKASLSDVISHFPSSSPTLDHSLSLIVSSLSCCPPLYFFMFPGCIVSPLVCSSVHVHPHFSLQHSKRSFKGKLLHEVTGLYIQLSVRPICLNITQVPWISISKNHTNPWFLPAPLLPPFLFLFKCFPSQCLPNYLSDFTTCLSLWNSSSGWFI